MKRILIVLAAPRRPRAAAPRRRRDEDRADPAQLVLARPRSASSPVTRSDGATPTRANHQVVSTTGTFASPMLAPEPHLLVHLRRGRDVPLPRRAQPARDRHGAGRRRAAGRSLGDLAAADHLRREGDAERPGQQQAAPASRCSSSTSPTARPRRSCSPPSSPARTAPSASPPSRDPDDLPGALEDGREPRRHDRASRRRSRFGRSNGFVTPRLRRPLDGTQAGAAAAALELRPVGDDQARLARPRLARRFRRRCRSVSPRLRIAMSVNQAGVGYLAGVQPRDHAGAGFTGLELSRPRSKRRATSSQLTTFHQAAR